MKKLSTLTAVSVGLIFVAVCLGLMTSAPGYAQRGAPPSDVRVINTEAQAVPTTVTSLPAVQISGTPTVNVGNSPSVNVNSLPAVQVGNGAGNPIPVNVTNLPGTESPGEPVLYSGTLQLAADNRSTQRTFFPQNSVPAGKRFVLDWVTYRIVGGNADDPPLAYFEDGQLGSIFYVSPDDHFPNGFGTVIQVSTRHVEFFSEPTQTPSFGMRRVSFGPAAVMEFSLHGRLLDVPQQG